MQSQLALTGVLVVTGLVGLRLATEPNVLVEKRNPDPVVATSAAELLGVVGLQSPGEPMAIEDKCCGTGGPCAPDQPQIWNLTNCETAIDPSTGGARGCVHQDWPCLVWIGSPARDEACVDPPPGAIVVAHCSMSPTTGACQKYKVGMCDWYWIPFSGLYCHCDLEGGETERTANGRKLCAAGSTPCSAIVPVGTATATGN